VVLLRLLPHTAQQQIYGLAALSMLAFLGQVMSSWLVILTGAIYAYIAAEQAVKGQMANAMIYSGYAFSNIGLFLVVK
jgi:hypothetical protein